MMRYLAGGVTETDVCVVRRCAEPNGLALIIAIPSPKPYVVPLARTIPDRLLECEVLFSAKKIQIAYRRFVVRPAKYRIYRDPQTRAQSDRVRRIPFCAGHGANEF